MSNLSWIDVGADAVARLCDAVVGRLHASCTGPEESNFRLDQLQVLKVAFAEAFAAFAKIVNNWSSFKIRYIC